MGSGCVRNYHQRLNEIRDYHRRYPNADVTEAEDDEVALNYEPPVEFSGEEVFGKYLDLHEQYNSFVNKSFGEQIEYAEYLTSFMEFEKVPRKKKLSKQYRHLLYKASQTGRDTSGVTGNTWKTCSLTWNPSTPAHIHWHPSLSNTPRHDCHI